MKISSTELRRVIQSVIRESYEEVMLPAEMVAPMPAPMHGGQSHDFGQKAQVCIGMAHDGSSKLADMCAQVCRANDEMMAKCFELCMCCCKCDLDGCCKCLSEICSCPQCAQICADCCGC